MTTIDIPAPRRRGLEIPALWIALWLQTGAVLPLLALSDEGLADEGRALLRMLVLPTYAITLVLALSHAGQVLTAMRRSLPLLALAALPVISVLWSINPSLSLRRTVALLMSLLLSYVLAVRLTPRQLLWLMGGVLGSCMVLSVGLMLADPVMAFMPGERALRGVYINKNVLGWAAAMTAVIGTVMVLDRAGARRGAGAALLAAGGLCLILSQSATGLMAALAALAVASVHIALARSRGTWRAILVVLIGLGVVLLVLFLGILLVPLLEALGKDATLTGRVPLWALVDAKIAERPLIGYGYQSFWSLTSSTAWDIWQSTGWRAPHAHNGYRDTLLSIGVLGLATLAWVMIQALLRGARLHRARPRDGWLWPNVLMGQILIINMTESTLMAQNDLQWILLSTVVIMVACRREGLPDR